MTSPGNPDSKNYVSFLVNKGDEAPWLSSFNFALMLISVALVYLLVMAVQSCRRRRANFVDMDEEGYFFVRGEMATGLHNAQYSSSHISYVDSLSLKSDNNLIEYNKSIAGSNAGLLRVPGLPASTSGRHLQQTSAAKFQYIKDDYCSQ
jgi:hypothetical protein